MKCCHFTCSQLEIGKMSLLIWCECPRRNNNRHRVIPGKVWNPNTVLLKCGDNRGQGGSDNLRSWEDLAPLDQEPRFFGRSLFVKPASCGWQWYLAEVQASHPLSASLCPDHGADSAGRTLTSLAASQIGRLRHWPSPSVGISRSLVLGF